jgi:membrane fusion protein (multidrug efflux system)
MFDEERSAASPPEAETLAKAGRRREALDGRPAEADHNSESPRPVLRPVRDRPPARHDGGAKPPAPSRSLRQRGLRWALFLVVPLGLIGGAYAYVTGGAVMSTDNAYVQVDKVGVSTDVADIVKEVDVKENQHVDAGQVLYRLDPTQFEIALAHAKANLAQTGLTLDSMKQEYKRLVSDAAAQQAQLDLDKINYDRAAALAPSGAISKSSYDQTRYALEANKSKLEAMQQQTQVQLAKLGGNPNTPARLFPQYQQALAQVEEAQRQLDHSVVRAAFAGTVTNVSSIAPGKYLAASTTAFHLVDTDHVWIDATPKETELTYVRPGQPVSVTVDMYPNTQWRGTVESISPAAAQEFSLLPAQNTSGNWVKVVQRVPIRIRVDTTDQGLPPLRAGMSAIVDIGTGHARGWPHFLQALF